LRPDGLGV